MSDFVAQTTFSTEGDGEKKCGPSQRFLVKKSLHGLQRLYRLLHRAEGGDESHPPEAGQLSAALGSRLRPFFAR